MSANARENGTLAFKPIGERHAIAEVVFALRISPEVSHGDRERLKNARKKWSDFLPGIEESPMLAFGVSSPGAQPPPPPVAPLDFFRSKSDGNLDWRLHISDGDVVVNCLTYTRWPDIWKRARRLFRDVSEVLPETVRVESVYLQYINIFFWSGPPEDYDLRALLDEQSRFVPASVFDRGPYWHLHQGWFSPLSEPQAGRILDRMHIDAIDDSDGRQVVKFENFHRFDFGQNIGVLAVKEAFSNATTEIDASFERLHDRAKESLDAYLTADIKRSIHLHAA